MSSPHNSGGAYPPAEIAKPPASLGEAPPATSSAAVNPNPGPRKRIKKDPIMVERANLLNMCKLIIKELIDSSLSQGRMLDDDHVPLQQFFIVLEHVLRHRVKAKKGILRERRDIWEVVEKIEKFVPDAVDITTSVRELPHIKSPLGRARAWLRLALMQKKLADYFQCLVDKREELLFDLYEHGAVMLEEEATVIGGLLVGLNVIDCNLGIKDEDLDQPMGVIDFSLYLNNPNLGDNSPREQSEGDAKMTAILDQKNYLEELNSHLNATVTNLQQKLESTTTANTLMKEDLAIAKNNILQLQQENSTMRNEKEVIAEENQKLHASKETRAAEAETQQSSADLVVQGVEKKLHEETQLRLDVEKELELQISMKQEMEMALRLLEKDIHEKQDMVISLRKQLEEIKQINIDMYNKMQDCECSLQHKTELVAKLEAKTTQMGTTIKSFEDKAKQHQMDKEAAEETARKLGQSLADRESKRSALETDLKIEREWRGTLQRNLEQEKEKLTHIQSENHQLHELKKEYTKLQTNSIQLQQTCDEQEKALSELGSHLSQSKLRVEDMKEAHLAYKDAQWTEDKDVSICRSCEKQFSVSRRKHHCRHCGEIFCNECSDNKMSLPSSAKPVRVCDTCHVTLLQRYSAS